MSFPSFFRSTSSRRYLAAYYECQRLRWEQAKLRYKTRLNAMENVVKKRDQELAALRAAYVSDLLRPLAQFEKKMAGNSRAACILSARYSLLAVLHRQPQFLFLRLLLLNCVLLAAVCSARQHISSFAKEAQSRSQVLQRRRRGAHVVASGDCPVFIGTHT